MKRVTSADVAREAGVSQSTVSRTFSGSNVSPEARKRVLAAAEKLGYKPNAIARSLSMQRTNLIGIVMGQMDSPFNPYVLAKFTQRLQAKGQQVLFFSVSDDQDAVDLLPQILQYQVDAMILTSITLSSAMVDGCVQSGIPVLLFNRTVPHSQVNTVCADNVAGGRLVADILLDAGHQQLAYIGGPENTSTNREREQGFCNRLQERGYSDLLLHQGDYTYQTGYSVAEQLLQDATPPDAIFCASDVIALGVLDQARKMAMRIPEQLSVIGFDDIPEAAWAAYNLTTIRQPVNRMVDATLELLEQRLAGDVEAPTSLLFPCRLIERGSARLKKH